MAQTGENKSVLFNAIDLTNKLRYNENAHTHEALAQSRSVRFHQFFLCSQLALLRLQRGKRNVVVSVAFVSLRFSLFVRCKIAAAKIGLAGNQAG